MISRRRAPARKVALAMWIVRLAIACFGLCCGMGPSTAATITDGIVLVVERPRADEGESRPLQRPPPPLVPRATAHRRPGPSVPDDVTYDVVLIPRRYQRFCALLC